MKIMIPTRGRADQLGTGTISRIPHSLIPETVLWTHSSEYELYREMAASHIGNLMDMGLQIHHSSYTYIGEKRHQMGLWAWANGAEKFCMLDDDVDFLIRRDVDTWRLREALGHEANDMFRNLSNWLGRGYAQAAISPREGNNRFGEGSPDELFAECTRAMRITAYRTRDFLSVEHDRVPVMEDFDVLLQLLRSGRKNVVLAYWANGQAMTNAPGGCSIWRTRELHNEAAERLAELHPQFVRLREKQNKTDAEGLGTRKEVTVQWKRAFQSSQT